MQDDPWKDTSNLRDAIGEWVGTPAGVYFAAVILLLLLGLWRFVYALFTEPSIEAWPWRLVTKVSEAFAMAGFYLGWIGAVIVVGGGVIFGGILVVGLVQEHFRRDG